MTILVIAEHDHQSLKAATLNTVTAASKIGADIHVLVAGTACAGAAQQAAQLQGVTIVKVADAAHYQNQTAENLTGTGSSPRPATTATSSPRPPPSARTFCRASPRCLMSPRSPKSLALSQPTPSFVRSTPAMPWPPYRAPTRSKSLRYGQLPLMPQFLAAALRSKPLRQPMTPSKPR
jgi:hypothetical protein